MLVRAACGGVVGICTPRHVRQVTPVSATVDAETRIVCQAVVTCAAARLVAEGVVAAGDEAVVELVAGGGVACAVAHEDLGAAHGRLCDAPVSRYRCRGWVGRVVARGCDRENARMMVAKGLLSDDVADLCGSSI